MGPRIGLLLPAVLAAAMSFSAETPDGVAGRAQTGSARVDSDERLPLGPAANEDLVIKVEKVRMGTVQPMGTVGFPAVSADGEWLFFTSDAGEFLPSGFGNGKLQIFRRHLRTGETQLVTANGRGAPADGDSTFPAVSPDGTMVAFVTTANDLPGATAADVPGTYQLVVKSLPTGTYTLVSRSAEKAGSEANGSSFDLVFSAAGDLVAFASDASDLVPGADANLESDIYLARTDDLSVLYRASTRGDGTEAEGGPSTDPSFTPDGRALVFVSGAETLLGNAAADRNGGASDVYIKTLATMRDGTVAGRVGLLSTDANGRQDDTGYSSMPALSPDGREVAFASTADDLVPSDGNGKEWDVFIKTIGPGGPLPVGTVRLVSRNAQGASGNAMSVDPVFSPDGTKLAFASLGRNLAEGASGSTMQILLKDLRVPDERGAVALVSRSPRGGLEANGFSWAPVFSPAGTHLYFVSKGTNLDGPDANPSPDIFDATLATPTPP